MSDSLAQPPFDKHPSFIVRTRDPFNGGPSPRKVRRAFVTSAEQFFVRCHGPVPQVDPATYRLRVGGKRVRVPLSLSLDELRSMFPSVKRVATLQCAGNRRDQFFAIADVPGEVPWGSEAISNAEWEGVALTDVLKAAGLADGANHVEFIGLDDCQRHGQHFGFGGSIPIDKALDPAVLLAWSMNGRPLPPVHGFPLRAVVPGYIGARSVKWLSEINVGENPSENYFQAHAYKLFPPGVTAQTADWQSALMLGELSVNSVITSPEPDATLRAGEVAIEGWAMSGGGRGVARVDISTDDGRTWTVARLDPEESRWTWRLWSATAQLARGTHRLVVRAWDHAANTQPEDPRGLWNFKGYMNNAWHRVEINVET